MAWTTVCYNYYWSGVDTKVVCSELGYTIYGTDNYWLPSAKQNMIYSHDGWCLLYKVLVYMFFFMIIASLSMKYYSIHWIEVVLESYCWLQFHTVIPWYYRRVQISWQISVCNPISYTLIHNCSYNLILFLSYRKHI